MTDEATSLRTRRIFLASGLAVFTVLLVLATRRLDLARVIVEIRHGHPSWLVAGVACYVASLPLWAIQWRILAPPGPRNTFSNMLGVAAINSTVYCTTVSLVGEASGVALLVTHIGLARTAAVSVIAMDQLLVGLTKLVVIGAATMAVPLPGWMRTGVISLSIAVGLLATCILIMAWYHQSIVDRMGHRLPERVAKMLGVLGRSFAPLRSPSRGIASFALALGKKGLEGLAIVCVQQAFDAPVPLTTAIPVLAALSLSTMLPIVPGNLGVFEATIVLIYTRLGMPAEQALGVAIVQHACYFAGFALPGYRWIATGARAKR